MSLEIMLYSPLLAIPVQHITKSGEKYLYKPVSDMDCRLTFKLYSNYLLAMQRKSILCGFKLVKVFYEE